MYFYLHRRVRVGCGLAANREQLNRPNYLQFQLVCDCFSFDPAVTAAGGGCGWEDQQRRKKDAEVSGQSSTSVPSFFTNVRATNLARSYWPWDYSSGDTYMVGGNKGEGGQAQWFTPGNYPKANAMNFYRNYRKLRSDFQKGQKKY